MIDRRHLLVTGAAALIAPQLAWGAAMSRITVYGLAFKSLDGPAILPSCYAGHPVVAVKTASLCGDTPQHTGLQALWTRYRDRGLVVLGVPSKDFGGRPRWNFHKYLIGRDGRLKAGFSSAVEPNDPRVIAAIEKELASA
ncbi:MAG: hypothetical protein HY543_10510 [Deltaproteobacteria bacterium]|nr:hypothetical protein [Deltaproteobacteria bacterium]